MLQATTWPEWRCPSHGVALAQEHYRLDCPAGHSFPRRDGIPRFVEGPGYADAFGAQWIRHRLTQLDSHSGLPVTEVRARRCLGEELWSDLAGRHVLEVGCGAGRFTEVLLGRGALVTSIDLSHAVEANRANFPDQRRHRVAQADATRLPFAPGRFDVVLCLGVVQHTRDSEQTIVRLSEQVRPGGALVLDHYRYRLSWFLSLAPLFRRRLRRLPAERGLRQTERMVDGLLPLHRRAARSPLRRRLLNRVSPVVSFYTTLPELPDELQREWALLDTHDSLTDWHKHYLTRRGLERILRRQGIVDLDVRVAGNGLEARGRRPAGE